MASIKSEEVLQKLSIAQEKDLSIVRLKKTKDPMPTPMPDLIDIKVEPNEERFTLIYDDEQIYYHYYDGSKYWYLNGKLHREDGPAIEYADGTKQWLLNGNLHREDGPAIEQANGTKSWWLNGKLLSHAKWQKEVAKLNQPCCNGKVVEIEGAKYKLMERE